MREPWISVTEFREEKLVTSHCSEQSLAPTTMSSAITMQPGGWLRLASCASVVMGPMLVLEQAAVEQRNHYSLVNEFRVGVTNSFL